MCLLYSIGVKSTILIKLKKKRKRKEEKFIHLHMGHVKKQIKSNLNRHTYPVRTAVNWLLAPHNTGVKIPTALIFSQHQYYIWPTGCYTIKKKLVNLTLNARKAADKGRLIIIFLSFKSDSSQSHKAIILLGTQSRWTWMQPRLDSCSEISKPIIQRFLRTMIRYAAKSFNLAGD